MLMNKKALITGINGQDGSFLSELLLEKGYDVHGIVRRTSSYNRGRIEDSRDAAIRQGKTFELHYGNMADASSLHRIVSIVKPDEIYNLASQSHVGISFDEPEYATNVDGTGVLRLLEAVRYTIPSCRIYQASTSELFGQPQVSPQNEETPFYPRSPYGVAKLYAYWIIRNYREAHGFHASNGIMFNHESERRGENFVTRKITYSLARIRAGKQDVLKLGNLDSRRDWGYAKDYVEAMWMMLQKDKADDYVIATGETHSVRDFINAAAEIAGFDIEWQGAGVNEKGIDRKTGKNIILVDPKFFRPPEKTVLCGSPDKADKVLGWKPKTSFNQLVKLMMKADIEAIC
jgi:GDPmannose 4,6-dehydratase